jgi:spore maturation protein CgeB
MRVFFILDKWCHGNKKFGESAWETNFITSFISLGIENEHHAFHFDKFHDDHPSDNANKALIEAIKLFSPDFIFLVIYERPGYTDKIINIESLEYIKSVIKIPIALIFGDLEHQEQVDILLIIEKFAALILYTAIAAPGKRINCDKLRYTWVPKDQKYFFKNEYSKKYDLTYFGSPKPERIILVNYLKKNNLDVFSAGGERQDNLPIMDYADSIRSSKICLSFSRAGSCHVINARVFEVISCGSMLLEQAGSETPKLFKPYVDYIPFFSKSTFQNNTENSHPINVG